MLIGSDGLSLDAADATVPVADPFFELFEHAPLATALVAGDDRILHANPALGRLTGYGRHDLPGRPLADLVHPDDRDTAAAVRRSVVRGEVPSSTADARLVRTDGRVVWVAMSWSGAGGCAHEPVPRLVVQLVDVTDRKRVERDLTRSNAELGSFAYLAAHELKSPLQSLTGFTALLDQVYGPGLDPQAREFITWIMDGARRMDSLIDALLAYCAVDRNEITLVPVALQSVFADALAQLAREVTSRGAVVSAAALPVVIGDPVQLGQLLRNLLANAIKFVPEGRPPQVHVSGRRTGDGWTITVADNGIGVEEGARERIFTMFERLHPRERYKGTGIGLSICKRMVERRGGAIWVEPNPTGGSCFRFSLPDVGPDPSAQGSKR